MFNQIIKISRKILNKILKRKNPAINTVFCKNTPFKKPTDKSCIKKVKRTDKHQQQPIQQVFAIKPVFKNKLMNN